MGNDTSRILVLTQNPRVAQLCEEALQTRDRQVVEVREAPMLATLTERGAELAILDLGMPDRALQAAATALSEHGGLPILVLSAGSLAEWDRFSRGHPLEAGLEAPFAAADLAAAAADLIEKSHFLLQRLVGRSASTLELRERILLIAPTPMTVLVTGESGTGKDVVAQALHHYSQRNDKPFKPINCAAIPENLLENELFGHEKGAFTDARAQHRGVFEQAEGGTVFLDEIGEMSLSAQVRLLRVLEERQVMRIGGDQHLPVDVRIIAASNRDLLQAVSQGSFRRDLYHRLKVVELHLPPLRERRDDIPVLIDHFVALSKDQSQKRFSGFSPAAMEALRLYDWPGNIRELRNLIDYLLFLGPARPVEPADLASHLESDSSVARHLPVVTNKTPDQSERELIYFALLDLKRELADLRLLVEDRLGAPFRQAPQPVYEPTAVESTPVEPVPSSLADSRTDAPSLKELERQAIERTLRQVGGNRRRAAEQLGIGVRTLYRKLDEYRLR